MRLRSIDCRRLFVLSDLGEPLKFQFEISKSFGVFEEYRKDFGVDKKVPSSVTF